MRGLSILLLCGLLLYEKIFIQESSFNWLDWLIIVICCLYCWFVTILEFSLNRSKKYGAYYITRILNIALSFCVLYTICKINGVHSTHFMMWGGVVAFLGLYSVFDLMPFSVALICATCGAFAYYGDYPSNVQLWMYVGSVVLFVFSMIVYINVSMNVDERIQQLEEDVAFLRKELAKYKEKDNKWWKIWN